MDIIINKIMHSYPDFNLKIENLELKRNNIIGLIGKNGAGKTTLMNLLSGYLKANGNFEVSGVDLDKIIYIPSDLELYEYLTVKEFIIFIIKYSETKKSVDEVIDLLELNEKRDFEISKLSQGMKKKLSLVNIFICEYDLIILDEPFNSIDVSYISELKKIIKQLSEKSTILISSHILDTLSNLCDEFIYIDKGKVRKQFHNNYNANLLEGELFE